MKHLIAIVLVYLVSSVPSAYASGLEPPKYETPYGNNEAAGRSVHVNGIQLYF